MGQRTVSSLPDPPQWEVEEELLVELALERRLDLRAAERVVSAARARLETELRSRVPSVQLGLSYERVDGVDALGPAAGVELPLFDQNQAQIAKARYLCEAAEKNLTALRLAVRLGVLRIYRRGPKSNAPHTKPTATRLIVTTAKPLSALLILYWLMCYLKTVLIWLPCRLVRSRIHLKA